MKKNLLIGQGQAATKILHAHVPTAKTFSDNDAKLYLIDCRLSDYRGNNNSAQLWVWGVLCGKRTYAGIICRSGIITDKDEISSAVFVSFHEDDILLDETDKLNRREICSGTIIQIDKNGQFYLKEEIKIPDNITAEIELKKKNPNLKGGAILLRFGEPKNQLTFWAIMGDNGYEAISPFNGETVCLSRHLPVKTVMIDESAGKGFYLTLHKEKKFVLTTKRATNR